MNLLAHLWLADRTATSAAGQILGDLVKGRVERLGFDAAIDRGIRLHRRIDALSDDHPAHRALRARFGPPLRRYAGIVVDIGFDHALAKRWHDYSAEPLTGFAHRMARATLAEWPLEATVAPPPVDGLADTLVGYGKPRGIQRALTAVGRRARRRNPLSDALPALLAENVGFEARLPELLQALEQDIEANC